MSIQPVTPVGKKILIIDDDAVVVKALTMKLASKGYAVVSALDPSSAMQSARREKPDIILLDINFPPDMGTTWDGFSIMQWFNRFQPDRKTPVIIISGGDPTKFKQKSIAAGAVAFFNKPVNNEELIETIQKALSEPPAPPDKKVGPGDPGL